MGEPEAEKPSPSSTSGRHLATAVCGWRGHVTPAARASSLDGPLLLGVDLDPDAGGLRLSRCLRCDAWVAGPPPDPAEAEPLPAAAALAVPARGRTLRDAVVERLIAIERGFHCVVFTVVAVLAILLRADLGGVQSWVRRVLSRLTSAEGTGAAFNRSFLVKEGNRLLNLRRSELTLLILIAIAYAVIEGVEAVGLWHQRRWAEYLTCLATVGFIPYEIYELDRSISALKIAALVVNLVILIYLVWAKRLFGVARFHPFPDRRHERDPFTLFARPAPAPTAGK